MVNCRDERSQHKNKSKAMRILRSRLFDQRRESARTERDQTRRAMIGSGDRSQKIRTYNFPQNRVTDHRIGLTLYNLDQVMQGYLHPLTDRPDRPRPPRTARRSGLISPGDGCPALRNQHGLTESLVPTTSNLAARIGNLS